MNIGRRLSFCALLTVLTAVVSVWPALAQDQPNVSDYLDPASAYHTSNFDYIDVFNHRVALNIPLFVDHSQRGNLNFTYSLGYASTTTWYRVLGAGAPVPICATDGCPRTTA